MESTEFVGKTTEEALEKASRHFELPVNRLEVELLPPGGGGFLGLFGGKKVRILVRPLAGDLKSEAAAVVAEATGMAPPRLRRAPALPAHAATPRPPETAAPDAPAGVLAPGEEDEDEEGGERRAEESPEVVEAARQVLARMTASLEPTAQVTSKATPHGIELLVEGGEAGLLIGRRGQTLEALQYLATRIVSHQQGRPVRILVDAGGYRQRRNQALEELALAAARKARQTHRPQTVGPFNAQERRHIHLTLRQEAGISTMSRGRGELKKIVVAPRGPQG